MKRHASRRRPEQGYILLFVLVALLAAAALVPLFARSLFERARTTVKTERQDLAAAELEARYADFRQELRGWLATGGALAFDGRNSLPLQRSFRSSANSLFTLEATLLAPPGAVGRDAQQMRNRPPLGIEGSLASYAGMADAEAQGPEMEDDPFFGAPAEILPLTLQATLTPRLAPASASDPVALEGRLRLAFRTIPASAFTLASWGDVRIGSGQTELGRVYARGTIEVAKSAKAQWRMAAGGAVTVQAGAQLSLQASRERGEFVLPEGFSTRGEDWLPLRTLWTDGPIPLATGRETPVALILPLPLATMLAPPEPPSPLTEADVEPLKFETHASAIFVASGEEVAASGPAGAQTAAFVRPYQTSRRTDGPIVRVDVRALVTALTESSLPARIVVRSRTPGTVVLLANAREIEAPFSLATPLPVFVAGEFNSTGRAASIITGGRLTSVIAEF